MLLKSELHHVSTISVGAVSVSRLNTVVKNSELHSGIIFLANIASKTISVVKIHCRGSSGQERIAFRIFRTSTKLPMNVSEALSDWPRITSTGSIDIGVIKDIAHRSFGINKSTLK